jgi:hypothetical protein
MFAPCCDDSNYKMSKTQNMVLRVTIVLAMVVAVVAVLYFTPLPGISLNSDLIRWLDLSALRKLNESILFNFFYRR